MNGIDLLVIWDETVPGWYWMDSQGKQGYFASRCSALKDYIESREIDMSTEELTTLLDSAGDQK